jgi:hypothetical protein
MKKHSPKINAAIKLFEDFTGDKPEYIDTVKLPIDTVCMAIGHCDGILYTTVREGQTEEYIHKFKKGARPVLAVSSDGKQLYLLGGDYRFTDRGIEDFKNG